MLIKKAGKPTPFKKTSYLIAATILGLLLSLLLNILIEYLYIRAVIVQGGIAPAYVGWVLFSAAALYLAGAIGGYKLGTAWWKWIYVDRVWEKNSKL